MKVSSIISGIFLLALFSIEERAELPGTAAVPFSSTGSPGPTLSIREANVRADGSFEFQVDSTEEFKVMIQSSADLTNWTFEALAAPHTPVVFTNRNESRARRFYRAADYTLRIHGIVRDIETEAPLEASKITISDNFWQTKDLVTQTDERGLFQAVISKEYPPRKITVEKTGYNLLTTEAQVNSEHFDFPMNLWLDTPGYRPHNDDFTNRFAIEGTNIVVRTRTFASTTELGHELSVFYDDYSQFYTRNLWWTWTAPQDGAVHIETHDARVWGGSGMAVYIGESLPELARVWDTYNFENTFFVKQGVQYQIAFGTIWPAATGFTLMMVPPVAPFGVHAWVGNGQGFTNSPIRVAGERLPLYVEAYGTSPLLYQWRKDGVEIPGATNAFFFKAEVELEDAGVYTAVVANEAGTAISDGIQITVLDERPHQPEILRGTWLKESPKGSPLITFGEDEFTSIWAAGETFAGSGRYRFAGTDNARFYRLVMTYSDPPPEIVRYFWVQMSGPDAASYQETGPSGSPTLDSGKFIRQGSPQVLSLPDAQP